VLPISNLGLDSDYPNWRISWVYSDPPAKYWVAT
jgi:hypothetical protein